MNISQGKYLGRAGIFSILFFIMLAFSGSALAVTAAPYAFTEIQPDGSEITLRARGDEHFNWIEDPDGYTVVKNNGWFEYGVRGPSGRINPNGMIVGRDNPRAAGLKKHELPSRAIRAVSAKKVNGIHTGAGVRSMREGVLPVGNIKNLVVMIRFSNHTGRSLPSKSDMEVLFNAVGGDATLAPTGSVKDVYLENSYGQMTLNSDVNPGFSGWIDVSNTESYYANGNSGDSTLWQALREALDQLDAVIDFNDYDLDNDGRIDSIAFIHSGYGAEWGGTDSFGTPYQSRIWSHRWAIQPQWNSNDGVSVFDYHISPGVWGTSGSAIGRIGVIAHETGHFFGLPDLYDTDQSAGDGIGSWGMMANSWGFDGSQQHPPHFSPWSKIDLGWLTPTVISQPGQYALNEVENNAEVYRINNGFSSGEYLLIENRQPAGFETVIPQGGLAIWHIDDTTGFNTQGYPGQSGWPGNGNHYRVALLQADGNYNLEKGNNRGDSGDMHHGNGVDAIGPGPGNHPNTDTYKDGIINTTGITISDISTSGSSMTFCLNGCTGIPAPSGLGANAVSTSQINLSWTDNSNDEDGFTVQSSADGSSWSNLATKAANATSHSDGSLSPATTRYYRVRAFDVSDTSAWSNTASATTDDVAPATPGNPPGSLSASAASASAIDLAWVDNAGNEDGYRVERSDNGVNGWNTIANLGANSTSHTNGGLQASTEYFYRVAAYNSAGDSGFASGSATTDAPPPFTDYPAVGQQNSEGSVSGGYSNTHDDDGSVQSITEQASSGNPRRRRSSLSHRWTFDVQPATTAMTLNANAWSSGSNDGDNFRFQWSTDGSSYTDAFVVSSTSPSNSQSAMLPLNLSGTVYVRVIDTDNGQGNAALDTVFVDYLAIRADNAPVTPPAAPTALNAVAVAHNQVDLDWTDNAGDETGFEIQRSTGGSFTVVGTVDANIAVYSDTTVSKLTTYTYRVRAMKGATPSGFSNTDSATTPDQPVGVINLSANGFKVKGRQQVDLTWSGSSATQVDIVRGGSIIATTANDGFYNDNIGAKGGATYQYQVCDAGTSNCSNTATVVF